MNLINLKSVVLDEVVKKGQQFYLAKLQEWLNLNLKGKFAAIDPETGESFIDSTVVDVMHQAHRVYPNKLFFVVKIGHETSCALKNSK